MLHTAEAQTGIEHQVQAMFHRVLTSWAIDALRLRQSGLDRPGPRKGQISAIAPAAGSCAWTEMSYTQSPPIRWKPRSKAPGGRLGEF